MRLGRPRFSSSYRLIGHLVLFISLTWKRNQNERLKGTKVDDLGTDQFKGILQTMKREIGLLHITAQYADKSWIARAFPTQLPITMLYSCCSSCPQGIISVSLPLTCNILRHDLGNRCFD